MKPPSQRRVIVAPNKITLTAQGRYLKVHVESQTEEAPIGGVRGKVSAFSHASRLRLLSYMHKIKPVRNFHATFITLTYGQSFPSPKHAKRHMDNFLKRFRRRWLYSSGFWRFEFQKRGAPHFHLLLFGVPFIPKETIAKWWAEVIGAEYADYSSGTAKPPFTRIESIRSHAHAARYVSKYVAKVETDGFNFLAYLTAAGEFIHPVTGEITDTLGRWWGVYNAIWLPKDVEEILVIAWGCRDVFYNLRRAAARIWKGRNNHAKSGWTLFSDNPYDFIRYANYLKTERELA